MVQSISMIWNECDDWRPDNVKSNFYWTKGMSLTHIHLLYYSTFYFLLLNFIRQFCLKTNNKKIFLYKSYGHTINSQYCQSRQSVWQFNQFTAFFYTIQLYHSSIQTFPNLNRMLQKQHFHVHPKITLYFKENQVSIFISKKNVH